MTVELHHGDSAEVLGLLPSDSVDLTVTSPPYDNLRTYDGFVFDFEAIAKELYRVTAPGGVVVWIVNDATVNGSETGTSFRQALFFKDCGFNLHDTMIWIKDGGGSVGSNKAYPQNTEFMFIFSKGKIKTTNLIADKRNLSAGKIKAPTGRRKKDGAHKKENRSPGAEFSKRNNWWYFTPSISKSQDHPAVFPEQIAHDHILSWSNPGDTVLDPFLGSGTTSKVAVSLGRNSIGIEINEKYLTLARERIERAELLA